VTDEEAMRLALAEAELAPPHGDVPVGAVVLSPAGEVLGRGHNDREGSGDPTAHAEVLALRAAAAVLGSWRLTTCTLVVTLEPCTMCGGAIVLSRVARLVYGAADPKAGAAGSASTPATTSGREFSRRSRTTSNSEPAAPAFGSAAP
jgi:tRNA(adenine34) deaminase